MSQLMPEDHESEAKDEEQDAADLKEHEVPEEILSVHRSIDARLPWHGPIDPLRVDRPATESAEPDATRLYARPPPRCDRNGSGRRGRLRPRFHSLHS